MDEYSRKKLIETSVDEFWEEYRSGQITKGRYNDLIAAKAQIQLETWDLNPMTIGHQVAQKYWERVVVNFNESYEGLKEAATRDLSGETESYTPVLSDIYNGLKGAWYAAMLAQTPLFAFGDVNGEMVRKMSSMMGASPGASYFLGAVTNVMSGFVPAGKVAKSAAKGVQGLAEKGFMGPTLQKIRQAAMRPKQASITFTENDIAKTLDEVLKPKEVVASPRQVEMGLGGTAAEATGEAVKPKLTPDAALSAVLEKLKAEGHEIDAASRKWVKDNVDAWFTLQPSQAELPFRIMGESLSEEGVKLPGLLETIMETAVPKAPLVAAKGAASTFAHDVGLYAKGTTIEQAGKELPDLAKRLGIDYEGLKNIVPGGRFDPKNPWYSNPKKMYGYLKALEDRASEIGPLAKAAHNGTEADKINFAQYMAKLFTAGPDEKPVYTKAFTDMLMHWDPENIAKGDYAAAVGTFAKDMLHMAESAEAGPTLGMGFGAVQAFGSLIHTAHQAGSAIGKDPMLMWRAVREVYYNSLLPWSFKAAFLGSTFVTSNTVLERAVGAMFSLTPGTSSTREAAYFGKALALATGDMTKAFAKAFETMSPMQRAAMQKGSMLPVTGRFMHAGHEIGGEIGQMINIPGDAMRGMDALFEAGIKRANYYAMAAHEADKVSGLTAAQRGLFIENRIRVPTTEMIEETTDFVGTATFQNQLGKYAELIQRALSWGPLALQFPFVKNGVHVMQYAWDRTPGLQLISKKLYTDIASGGRKADAAIGRLVMAQMLGHMYYEFAKDGIITDGGPVDYQQRKVWNMVNEPHSVATGEGYVPLAGYEPFSTAPGMIADLTMIRDSLPEMSAEQAMAAVGYSFMHNYADGTWWQANSRLVDMMQTLHQGADFKNPQYKMMRAPLTAPFNVFRPITKAIDPLQRESRDLVTDFRNKVWWTSKKGNPARDPTGDPIVPPQAFGGSWWGLMKPVVPAFKKYETDPLKQLLAKHQVKAPQFTDHIGGRMRGGFDIQPIMEENKIGIRLNDEQLNARWEFYQKIMRHPEFGIMAMVNDPRIEWNSPDVWSDPGRRSRLEGAMREAWKSAGDATLLKYPDLLKQSLENDKKHEMALTPDNERARASVEMDAAIGGVLKATPEMVDNLMKFGIMDAPSEPSEAAGPLTQYATPQGPLTQSPYPLKGNQ